MSTMTAVTVPIIFAEMVDPRFVQDPVNKVMYYNDEDAAGEASTPAVSCCLYPGCVLGCVQVLMFANNQNRTCFQACHFSTVLARVIVCILAWSLLSVLSQ
jgi:hypothetical protein